MPRPSSLQLTGWLIAGIGRSPAVIAAFDQAALVHEKRKPPRRAVLHRRRRCLEFCSGDDQLNLVAMFFKHLFLEKLLGY